MGKFDLLHLPIDPNKNKRNLSYHFIKMSAHTHIISLYEVFNGKTWDNNSTKVASLARLQGINEIEAFYITYKLSLG